MGRHMIKRFSAVLAAVVVSVSIVTSIPGGDRVVRAADTTIHIEGKQYTLEEHSKYEYPSVTPSTITSSGSQFGIFSITGDMTSISDVSGFPSYMVNKGTATLTYAPTGRVVGAAETDWHIYEDKSTEVNGEKISEKVQLGTVILQTSNDGSRWITDVIHTDIADSTSGYAKDFYETKEIQLINGCYYRVIVAYELERRLPDTQIWFASFEKNEYKKYVEVYEFYLKDDTDAMIAAGAHPNTLKVVGDMSDVTNTGKDNGFSGQNAITNRDPHYGWKIGEFTLRGYTNTADYQGEEYFLKNLGDAITLTFNLAQDIECLNGNTSLSIASDKNGWDQYFQVNQTDFKHGTLIIRHTDFHGNKSEPIIYTDYLAAYARTGADTRVQFFEEGDYEVALDYEIKNSSGIDSYTDYRMFFTFKIRNGNNMVYAFDNGTRSQLADRAWTASGFTIDTANSHYLTVTVEKYVVVDGVGGKRLDLSWSRTANDGNSYTDGGMYIVSVSNRYQPNGDVSKTFYVGNDPYIRAIAITGKTIDQIVELVRYTDYDMQEYLDVMSREHKSLDEIVSLVNQGYEIGEDGELIAPPEPEPEMMEAEETLEVEEAPEPEVMEPQEPMEEEPAVEEQEEIIEEEATAEITLGGTDAEEQAEADEPIDAEGEKKASRAPIIVFLAIGVSAIGYFAAKKSKKGSQSGDSGNTVSAPEEEKEEES